MTAQPVEPAAGDAAATQLDRIEEKLDVLLDLLAAVAETFGPRMPIMLRAKLAAAMRFRRN